MLMLNQFDNVYVQQMVKKLWDILPDNKGFQHINFSTLRPTTVVGSKRQGLIVEAISHVSRGLGKTGVLGKKLVCYPEPDDAVTFFKGAKSLRDGGPAQVYAGSVASLDLTHEKGSDGSPNLFLVENLQGHCREDALKTIIGRGSRAFVSKYGGGNNWLLAHVFKLANEQSVDKVCFKVSKRPDGSMPEASVRAFRETAEKNRFCVEELRAAGERFLVARRRAG